MTAMQEEADAILKWTTDQTVYEKGMMRFISGKIGDNDVCVAISGVGKVNAAAATQAMIDCYGVSQVINVGVAGALASFLSMGDIVVATDAVQYDVDATASEFALGEVPLMDRVAYGSDEKLIDLARSVKDKTGLPTHFGRVLTADRVVANKQLKDAIHAHFEGICAEMEGAAVAQVAEVNGVPVIIIRGISDLADEDLTETYAGHFQSAVERTALFAVAMVSLINDDTGCDANA
ncbi:MAG: 5'-methylthioadenosine/adenosylhomocysteine nucleosidase [Eubacteriaceae bacterium]|nr:5'-methylthioadenosine/adenosylhomocysteine nucleosidase [Eubacteriaceae bacterium]